MPAAPVSPALIRLPRPDFVEELSPPRKRWLTPVRRRIKRSMLTAIDRGWFGLRPLRAHVVICGFPRSGSTLLQLQVETCVSDLRSFGTEIRALLAADWALRNHPYMLTKDPNDVFFLDEIREFYAKRRADVRFVLTLRDPRAVLTSVHGVGAVEYYLPPSWWPAYYEHFRYAQWFDDVMTVKYEDLVTRPAEVEQALTESIGWHIHLPFDRFHTRPSPGFRDSAALNGLRPLDPTRVAAWKQEKHRDRIREVLQEIPGLPESLVEMGYEPDTSWVDDYL